MRYAGPWRNTLQLVASSYAVTARQRLLNLFVVVASGYASARRQIKRYERSCFLQHLILVSLQICSVLESVCKHEGISYLPSLGQKIVQRSDRNLRRALLILETCHVQRFVFTQWIRIDFIACMFQLGILLQKIKRYNCRHGKNTFALYPKSSCKSNHPLGNCVFQRTSKFHL